MNVKIKPPREVHQITSVYSAFFSGGARNVHTDVIHALHEDGVSHRVTHIFDSVNRNDEGIQHKHEDPNYQRLFAGGFPINSLGLTHNDLIDTYGTIQRFSGKENPDCLLEASVRKMAHIILSDDPDALLSLKEQPVNLLVLASRYIVEVMSLQAKPIIVTLHRTDPGLQDSKSLRMLAELEHTPATKRFIAGYIACAQSSMFAYQAALGLTGEAQRFKFVPNGINLNVFRPRPVKEINAFIARRFSNHNTLPAANSSIVTIGARNSPEKNIELFLQAACLFLRCNPEAHAVMCGSGMDTNGLRLLMAQTADSLLSRTGQKDGPQNRIHMLGKVSSDDMATLLSMSKIVALTSPTLGEADPLVLKEGMLCGAIPVTTCCGDAPRVVQVSRPEQHMLKPVNAGFIVGGRGILTSQCPRDIARAWSYAIEHADEFQDNIADYKPELGRSNMGRGYRQTIVELIANHVPHV